MNNYIIFTDSACDLTEETLADWGVKYIELTYTFSDSPRQWGNYELDAPEFYQKMREGGVAKTSAININGFIEAFEPIVADGADVLYLGFSGGLSSTVSSAAMAANQLCEKYPERRIIVIDTLAASAGQGLLVHLAVEAKRGGADMDAVAAVVRENILKLAHWFTVDDLVYLKRGGRVSAAAAFVGGMLGIKPVLHVDNEGHLIAMEKVRGRRTSLKLMAQKYAETAETPDAGVVYISHGDCIDDALTLAGMLKEAHGVDVSLITEIGSVIGAHSGPGTLALFYIAKER
ncbi:MAG: DegV family protein [Ruminococcaceae bacterium]|nr:DegV family protein [Oscillospiraceae bacterium]